MRPLLLLLLAMMVALAGCEDRRSFDQRYEDTSRDIENRVGRLDRKLDAPPPAGNFAAAEAADKDAR